MAWMSNQRSEGCLVVSKPIGLMLIKYTAEIAITPPTIVDRLGVSAKNSQLMSTALTGTVKMYELDLSAPSFVEA